MKQLLKGTPKKKASLLEICIVLFSGILIGITEKYFVFPLGWVCYVGLFYILLRNNSGYKSGFLLGFIVFFIQGLVVLSWVPDLINRYSAGHIANGWIFSVILSLVFALKGGFLFSLSAGLLKRKGKANFFKLGLILLTCASVFALTDWIFMKVFEGLPWFFYFIGCSQIKDLYLIQLAEIGGIAILSFATVLINLWIALAWYKKSFYPVLYVIVILVMFHLYGIIRISTLGNLPGKQVKVALICDNTPPDIRWNKNKLNEYVHQLLSLNAQAISNKPDLIIWNEGSIPWTYRKDDDLLRAVLHQNKDTGLVQIMSYYSISPEDSSCTHNSAYAFGWDGKVIGRYDKNILLDGLEKPLWNISGWILPFLREQNANSTLNGKSIHPVIKPGIGKIGIILCNESLTDKLTTQLGKDGVDFIIVMANDNWFYGTQLINQHFLSTRLRAIETRKEIILNANMGYSGIVEASGKYRILSTPDEMKIVTTEIFSYSGNSSFYFRENCIFLILLLIILFNFFYKNNV